MSDKVTSMPEKKRPAGVTFWRVTPMRIDLAAARDQYNNPEIDYTNEERRHLLALVDLIEDGRLADAVAARQNLTRDEREYIMIDIDNLLTEYARYGETIYAEEPKGEIVPPLRRL